jgi:hypothetical protein
MFATDGLVLRPGLVVIAQSNSVKLLTAAGIPDLPISIHFSPAELEERNLVDALAANESASTA